MIIPIYIRLYARNVYPITLPTLKPPNTNATARERSSIGINLHMMRNLTNQKDEKYYNKCIVFVKTTPLAYNLKDQDLELKVYTHKLTFNSINS